MGTTLKLCLFILPFLGNNRYSAFGSILKISVLLIKPKSDLKFPPIYNPLALNLHFLEL